MSQETPPTSLRARNGRLERAVRAFAAGLSPEELRAMLRGEVATERPNPRYRAHVASFLLHVRPRTYAYASTWFTHTWRLGFLAVLFFIIELITGLALMFYYVPAPQAAYASILRLQGQVPWGEVLRDVHRLAAELMVVTVVLHLLRTFLTKSYHGQRVFTWITGVALLLLTLLLTFSGYLLPWDQLAYWAVTIGTSMVDGVPLIGAALRDLLRGAAEIGSDGLLRFYQFHVVALPLLTFLLLATHYYRVARIHSISVPAKVEEGNLPEPERQAALRRVDLVPDLLIHEVALTAGVVLALLVAALLFYDAPLESHANPLKTPLHAQAPWFFLWVQGLLKFGNKTITGALIPALLVLLLFLVPFLDRKPQRLLRKRPLAVGLALAAAIGLGVLTFMGTPTYGIALPPAVEISQDLAADEGLGGLRGAPFEEVSVGVYIAGKTDPATLPPAFGRVFSRFSDQIQQARDAGMLPEGRGLLVVEDWQAQLRRVTIRIGWSDPSDGTARTYERIVFLHEAG